MALATSRHRLNTPSGALDPTDDHRSNGIRFRLLGPMEFSDDANRVVPLNGERLRTLFALLLISRGELVTVNRMIGCVWGEHPPTSARKNIQTYVWRIRRTFGRERLQRCGAGYVLQVRSGELDVEVFESLTVEGERLLTSNEPARARSTLDEAIALWRGTPFDDVVTADPPTAEITRLSEMYHTNLENHIEADLRCGCCAEAIAELRSLISEHPFRERLRSLLMLALNQCGRRVEALTVFTDFRVALQSEFGIDPGPEMHEIQNRVLCGEETPAEDTAASSQLGTATEITAAPSAAPRRRLA